ncbi:hypothetical protein [Burkholderia diffusa]|uniref:hypothetical protein n=1 Tax=Burkholderia diffusa TaxID=488732 RepID=UPI0020C5EE32|nr:hypothetical protein [Burkholderia diffusa]
MEENLIKQISKYLIAAIAALLASALALFAILVYVKNWDGGDGVCPDMSKTEIASSADKYARHNGATSVTFDEEFEYIKDLNQWKIPYRSNGHRYIAKMTCPGVIIENVGPYD